MSEKFITDVKSIDILKERMKDIPKFNPPATELHKYRKFRKVKLNKNESISN
tara:strand:- start:1615 stop:1770 length:156 start_codon:yes stop_codon:yes gene_type:complete